MDAYSKLLLSPQWQRKRLEIMQRDNFTCVRCGDSKTTLNVHHIRYVRGRKPWEYEPKHLETLCAPCHKNEHGKSSRTATPQETIRVEFIPELYSDPVRAKALNDEITRLQESLKKEEAGQGNFPTVMHLMGLINDLIKEKQSLKRVR
jgi:hypothetical protein